MSAEAHADDLDNPQSHDITRLHASSLKQGELFPPLGWGIVEPGLYRANTPGLENFGFLKPLNISTVIAFTAQATAGPSELFFRKQNARVLRFECENGKLTEDVLDKIVIKQILELALDNEHYPVLIYGPGDAEQVDIIIGCMRRFLGWNLNSILIEYRFFVGDRKRPRAEIAIECFDPDVIVIPAKPPCWYTRLVDIEKVEAEEYFNLVKEGKLSDSGELQGPKNLPPYRVHYYDTAAPLSSTQRADPPVVNIPLPRVDRRNTEKDTNKGPVTR